MSKKKEISRRVFLTRVAAGGAACAIVPRHVLGRGFTAPSDTLDYDGAKMRITNALQANDYLRSEYGQGWST